MMYEWQIVEREKQIRRMAEDTEYMVDDVIQSILLMQDLLDSEREVDRLDRVIAQLRNVQGELQTYE